MSTFTPTISSARTGDAPVDQAPLNHAAVVTPDSSRDSRAIDGVSIRLDSAEPTQEIVTAISVLAKSAVAELRLLRVDESDQEIHLTGRVRSFYHKQLAQEAIRPIAAGRQVVNRVDVCERV